MVVRVYRLNKETWKKVEGAAGRVILTRLDSSHAGLVMNQYMDARQRNRLKAHCKMGRLFDAQSLLDEVGTARLRKTRKWTPLLVAVNKGFHSLVEVLLRYDHAQWDLEKGYRGSLTRRRPDLAGLILRSPSWSGPIDAVEALATGDLILAESLKNSGADFVSNDTLLRAAVRNARGVLAIVDHLGIEGDEVEDQLYSAMVTHASLGHVPSVMQFLRRGFDPHRVVSFLDEVDGELCDEGSAVSASMHCEKPGFFAALRPDPNRDDAEELLSRAVFYGSDKMMQTLLDAGFDLNCKENGGAPVLDVLLGDVLIGSRTRERNREIHRNTLYFDQRIQALVSRVEYFVSLGARWMPNSNDPGNLQNIRDVLLATGGDMALKLIRLLEEKGVSSSADINILLRPARMKEFRETKRP